MAYPPEPMEAPAVPQKSQVEGFDLDTDAEKDTGINKGTDTRVDDLDFSDDEIFFETEKKVSPEKDAEKLDLSMDKTPDYPGDETDAGDGLNELGEMELPDADNFFTSGTDDFNDLELGLELDRDEEALPGSTDPDAGDIDLSELEKILELDGTADTDAPGTETDAFNFDLEPETGTDTVVDDDERAEIAAEELDLSDIEKMLEIDAPPAIPETEPEDEELVFDLDVESAQMTEDLASETQFEPDELDLSDLEDILEEDKASEPAGEIDDLDLDFGLEEDDAAAGKTVTTAPSGITETTGGEPSDMDIDDGDAFPDLAEMAEKETELVKTFEMGAPEGSIETESMEAFSDIEKADERAASDLPPRVAAKKGVSLPLVILLILALLAGGVYYVYRYTDIKIPYLSEMKAPEVQDAGGLKMTTFGISSRFVENDKAGRFFVITGKIKNEYPDARGAIKINGKLYSKGKVLEKAQTVFCGNILTQIELAELDVEAIKKRLSSPIGDNRSNVKVAPGGMIPFMVVFTELPDNLEEYTIEVTGSQAK